MPQQLLGWSWTEQWLRQISHIPSLRLAPELALRSLNLWKWNTRIQVQLLTKIRNYLQDSNAQVFVAMTHKYTEILHITYFKRMIIKDRGGDKLPWCKKGFRKLFHNKHAHKFLIPVLEKRGPQDHINADHGHEHIFLLKVLISDRKQSGKREKDCSVPLLHQLS